MELIDGLAPLVQGYDALILDLWGVAHDGRAPYPAALDCLERLGAAGKRRLFLSNAPRRAGAVVPVLAEMGIEAGRHFDHLVTSGDLTRAALEGRGDAFHGALGRRYLQIGPERDRGLLSGLDYAPVAEAEAEFVLESGLYDDRTETLDDYAPLLGRLVARDLPMVCANPDLTVMRGAQIILCAGSIAGAYEALGGRVRSHGKPDASAYDHCLALLGAPERGRVLAIGDSLRTDIRGANAAGIDVFLVTQGIHADEFAHSDDGGPDLAAVAAACEREDVRPLAVMRRLGW